MLKNGENYITVNGIQHWYKISGAEHNTIPIIVVHDDPGGKKKYWTKVRRVCNSSCFIAVG
ncbi:hypothetical protein [Bacillus manliponensis]|uniref:hypothetical protein n=1 Tax=Bacillus manliponensis TaxID=574376 RepID=UPI003516365B